MSRRWKDIETIEFQLVLPLALCMVVIVANRKIFGWLMFFTRSASEWQKVKIAAEVSKAVYEDFSPRDNKLSVPAAWNSTTKTMTLETRAINEVGIIVVGVRGTVTVMDWAVNANGEPADASEVRSRFSASECH